MTRKGHKVNGLLGGTRDLKSSSTSTFHQHWGPKNYSFVEMANLNFWVQSKSVNTRKIFISNIPDPQDKPDLDPTRPTFWQDCGPDRRSRQWLVRAEVPKFHCPSSLGSFSNCWLTSGPGQWRGSPDLRERVRWRRPSREGGRQAGADLQRLIDTLVIRLRKNKS